MIEELHELTSRRTVEARKTTLETLAARQRLDGVIQEAANAAGTALDWQREKMTEDEVQGGDYLRVLELNQQVQERMQEVLLSVKVQIDAEKERRQQRLREIEAKVAALEAAHEKQAAAAKGELNRAVQAAQADYKDQIKIAEPKYLAGGCGCLVWFCVAFFGGFMPMAFARMFMLPGMNESTAFATGLILWLSLTALLAFKGIPSFQRWSWEAAVERAKSAATTVADGLKEEARQVHEDQMKKIKEETEKKMSKLEQKVSEALAEIEKTTRALALLNAFEAGNQASMPRRAV